MNHKNALFCCRNGSFSLDNCEVLTGALIKLINKCYWNTSDSEGCMTSDENELSEACIKSLTVNIDDDTMFFFTHSGKKYKNW